MLGGLLHPHLLAGKHLTEIDLAPLVADAAAAGHDGGPVVKTPSAYGRELGAAHPKREYGQIPKPEETWIRREVPALRLINLAHAARVDARRTEKQQRHRASLARGHAPEKAHGKYLLSGGRAAVLDLRRTFRGTRPSPW